MKLIIVSPTTTLEKEAAIYTQMFEMGLTTLHLRKPKYSTRRFKNLIAEIPEKYHNRIVIHMHHMLALKFNIAGIHLTKTHKKRKLKTWLTVNWLKYKRPDLIVTTSYSKMINIIDNDASYNYVFLSPIFHSTTSKYQAGFTEHSLIGALEKSPFKVIARGGIEANKIKRVHEMGFYGLVVTRTIWNKENILAEFDDYVNEFKALGLPLE